MPRSVYLILITLFVPFQSHPPPFPEDLILLVFSIYTSFPLNYTCLLAFAIFPWPSFSPKLSSHCPFPFTTQLLESVLCAPWLQFFPSFLSVGEEVNMQLFACWLLLLPIDLSLQWLFDPLPTMHLCGISHSSTSPLVVSFALCFFGFYQVFPDILSSFCLWTSFLLYYP